MPKITIITPTPKITPYIKKNLENTPGTDWLIVWTNSEKNPPTNLKKNVKVVNYPKKYLPIRNFSILRNWSLKQVNTTWVFFLDSDEVVSAKDWTKVLKLTANAPETTSGYLVKREDVFLGKTLKHGEVGNVWLLRLGKRKFIRYERAVHEIAGIKGMTQKTHITLKHYSHPSISAFLNKVFFYALLEVETKNTNIFRLWTELLVFPQFKFFLNFVLKLGFLDGMRGLVYASVMSLHSLLVRVYQLEKS